MNYIEYEALDFRGGNDSPVVLCVVAVPISTVLIEPPCPHLNDPLPPAAAQPFIDACLKFANLPAGDYDAVVERFPDCHQPWPVFVCQNWEGGDCVGEFYPKNFEAQTIV